MQNYSINSQVMTITPDLAKSILQGNTMNRPLNSTTVLDYATQMEKGLWKLNGEPIIISTTGGLLDGQHRLEAVCLSGVPIKSVVIYNVDPDSFSTIDTGRIRTTGDMMAIEGITNAAQKASAVMAYFKMIRKNQGKTETSSDILGFRSARSIKISKKEMLDFYTNNSKLVDDCVSAACACVRKIHLIKISAIAGYMLYLILVKNHPFEKVQSFFNQVHQLEAETDSSITALRTQLIRNITKQHVLGNELCHVYITKAWNSFVTGKNLQTLSYNKTKEGTIQFV